MQPFGATSLRLVAGFVAAALAAGSMAAPAVMAKNSQHAPAGSSCDLGNGIQHVIYVQFNSTHLARDANGVYSDLEQMPHLLNFLTDNGKLLFKAGPTDLVPTMDAVLGLTRDYQTDGRVITQILTPAVLGGGNGASFDLYKHLNAPYEEFAHSLILASTNGHQG